MNKILNINKAFKKQVKIFMKTAFGTTTQQHISKILLKPNERVLVLLMFYETRKKSKENVQSVELCNI